MTTNSSPAQQAVRLRVRAMLERPTAGRRRYGCARSPAGPHAANHALNHAPPTPAPLTLDQCIHICSTTAATGGAPTLSAAHHDVPRPST